MSVGDLNALEVFGGAGDLHTSDYARLVKSLTVWEINASLEQTLRRNLPGASIKVTDALAELRSADQTFQLVVVDNPLYVSEASLCEHFDLFPAIFRVLADKAILVMNVMPEASPAFRAEFHVFNAYHLKRRAQFYGSATPERIPIDEMAETYRALAQAARFEVDWHFSRKRGRKNVYFLVLRLRRSQA